MRKFRYAGVSKVDGVYRLRASNRDNYDQILVRDKNTAINIIDLGKPTPKDKIAAALVHHKEFKAPAILKLLHSKLGDDALVTRKAPAKKTAARKTRAAEPQAAAA